MLFNSKCGQLPMFEKLDDGEIMDKLCLCFEVKKTSSSHIF